MKRISHGVWLKIVQAKVCENYGDVMVKNKYGKDKCTIHMHILVFFK